MRLVSLLLIVMALVVGYSYYRVKTYISMVSNLNATIAVKEQLIKDALDSISQYKSSLDSANEVIERLARDATEDKRIMDSYVKDLELSKSRYSELRLELHKRTDDGKDECLSTPVPSSIIRLLTEGTDKG